MGPCQVNIEEKEERAEALDGGLGCMATVNDGAGSQEDDMMMAYVEIIVVAGESIEEKVPVDLVGKPHCEL